MEETRPGINQVFDRVNEVFVDRTNIFLGADMTPLSEVDLPTAVRFVIKQLRAMVDK